MGYPPPNEPPPGQGAPQQAKPDMAVPPERKEEDTRKAATSLILAFLSLASMVVTAPLAAFAMLATYPSEGPSNMPWVTPLVFFSLPLLLAVPALVLSIPLLKESKRASPGRPSAAAALCMAGLVVALAIGPALDQLGN
jgi:hypothetical protein